MLVGRPEAIKNSVDTVENLLESALDAPSVALRILRIRYSAPDAGKGCY